jgi:hypothetical protein
MDPLDASQFSYWRGGWRSRDEFPSSMSSSGSDPSSFELSSNIDGKYLQYRLTPLEASSRAFVSGFVVGMAGVSPGLPYSVVTHIFFNEPRDYQYAMKKWQLSGFMAYWFGATIKLDSDMEYAKYSVKKGSTQHRIIVIRRKGVAGFSQAEAALRVKQAVDSMSSIDGMSVIAKIADIVLGQ